MAPAPNYLYFSGLPLSSAPELLALFAALPFLFSGGLRARYRELFDTRRTVAGVLLAAGVLALGAKVLLLSSGTFGGFSACYRALDVPGPAGCERSYENPFFFSRATRVDKLVDFGDTGIPANFDVAFLALHGPQFTNWDLSFMNSTRFNVTSQGAPEIAHREWVRFGVRWQGTFSSPASRHIEVSYAGEGTLLVDGFVTALAPSYAALASARISLTPGRHDLVLNYRFAPTSLPTDPVTTPYATVHLTDGRGAGLHSSQPGSFWRVAGAGCDVITGLLILALLAVWGAVLRQVEPWLLAFAVALGAIFVIPHVAAARLTYEILVPSLVLVLLLAFRRLCRADFGLVAYATISIVEVMRAVTTYQGLTTVLYRGAGQDFLTYESLARGLLETHSFQGGERIFVYSPAFRYLLFAIHVVIGDGDVVIGVAGTLAFTFCLVLVTRCLLGEKDEVAARQMGILVVVLALVVAVQASGIDLIRMLVSEYPTWIFITLALYCLLNGRSLPRAALASALLGLCLAVRFNQGAGLLLMLAAVVAEATRGACPWRQRVARAALVVSPAVGIALLPAVHNLYYGGHFVLAPTTPNLPVNFPVPYGKALSIFSNPEVRTVFWRQLRAVTAFELLPGIVLGDQSSLSGRFGRFRSSGSSFW